MYFEQQPLQFASYDFLTVNLPIYYNIGWWRFNEEHSRPRLNWLNIKENDLYLANNRAVCFHAHTLKDLDYQNFGNFLVEKIFSMMRNTKNQKYQLFLNLYEKLKREISE